MKNYNEKGVVNIDYITAIVIFMIGSVAILALYMNTYKSMAKIKVDETIAGYITEVCENIDLVSYEDVDTEAEVNHIISSINIPNKYTLQCESIEKYSNTTSTDTLDLVLRINLRINYTFDNLTRNYVISKIKVKE